MPAYADTSDFCLHGLPEAAVDDDAAVQASLSAASRTIDSYLSARTKEPKYSVPLDPYPDSIKECACKIAAWEYVSGNRGRQTGGPDEMIRLRYEDAMRWLRELRDGKVDLIGIEGETAPTEVTTTELEVYSDDLRGW
ncbi:MAG: DUF1320 domain-containing protein [Gammaproteobacteria bacterium]|nr:DUF1320 domain-containing protein [Gammaproteobacteria bacterium]